MERDELIRAVEEARRLATEAKLEGMVLQTVCAALMAELAAMSEDPQGTLDRMVASLHGLAFGVAHSGGQPHTTRTVQRICQMAEDSLQAPGSPAER
jgi:hypothetical protein